MNERVLREFPLDSLYFNTAYSGPSPLGAKTLVEQALAREIDPGFHPYDEWVGTPDRIRRKIAALLECPPEPIALSTSTTDIIGLVANGFDWKEGDVVCSLNGEYPANVLPWMVAEKRQAFEFRLLEPGGPVDADWLAKALPAKCRVLDLSWVAFNTGARVDIESVGEFCRRREILFVVDATQALGGMPILKRELDNLDVLACSTYKWMLGPYGGAFGYFSPTALEKINRTTGNWIVSPNSGDVSDLLDYTLKTKPGACRFDRGQAPNMLFNACLSASLDLLKEIGLAEIQKHNQKLCRRFLENFPAKKFDLVTPQDRMAGIVCLKFNDAAVEERLRRKKIDVSVRQGNLRISFHLFNRPDQVDALVEALG